MINFLCRFRQENMAHLTTNQRAQFSTLAAARWLDLRLRLLGVVIVGSIAFIAVIQHQFQGVDPGMNFIFDFFYSTLYPKCLEYQIQSVFPVIPV